ncbi:MULTISPECIES: helix-turn-helix domain-containing protein [unclassified Frankia]|uniref:winged helix-turn-helix transcriptional regulator n=1 Tax=unclassified Frankia TaxID=2632575 RepID=UPI002AD3B072|nr:MULTISPECIES: helix-turn-helix domain-containing protein [unclassified Frankia]
MLGRTYEAQNCSAARALEVVGERWSLLIIRDALFRGITRFTDFQRSLGVAPNILANRLDGFVAAELMAQHQYGPSAQQREYLPTDKGRALQPVIIALTAWGDRWYAPQGPPIDFIHTHCGTAVRQDTHCPACGTTLSPQDVRVEPGPGGRHRAALA